MINHKYLIEMSGSKPGDRSWERFSLPDMPATTECKLIAEAMLKIKQMCSICTSAIEKTMNAKAEGVFSPADVVVNKLYATTSLRYGMLYIQWNIIKVLEDGTRQTPVLFKPTPHVRDKYGIPEIRGWAREGAQIPYYGLMFAQMVGDTMVSRLKADNEQNFELTIAKQLLNDPEVDVSDREVLIGDQEGVNFYLPLKNEDCIIFQPTAFQAPSDCSNVETDYDVEIVFAFDEFLLPMTYTVKTSGETGFPITLLDVIQEVRSDLSGGFEDIDTFFKDCKNRRNIDGGTGFYLDVYSEGGQEASIAITPEWVQQEDMAGKVVSVRIVRMWERMI